MSRNISARRGPAVRWANQHLWFWHGIWIPEHIGVHREELGLSDVLGIRNPERRRVVVVAEVSGSEALRAVLQSAHRNTDNAPDEEPAQSGNQQQGAARIDEHAAAAFSELHVGLLQGEIGVEDAEYLLLYRMSVAGGIRASGLVFDGSNDAENARASAVAVNAEAIGSIQSRERLRLRMASIAGFSSLIHHMIDFGGISSAKK